MPSEIDDKSSTCVNEIAVDSMNLITPTMSEELAYVNVKAYDVKHRMLDADQYLLRRSSRYSYEFGTSITIIMRAVSVIVSLIFENASSFDN